MYSAKLDILLATYNGEEFLEAQLRSILGQVTKVKFRVLISDDGSSDGTMSIIDKYVNLNSNIEFIEDSIKHRGAKNRFAFLMRASNAEYTMFSDQDDVWLPDKVDIMLNSIIALEKSHALNTPIMCYSDLVVVNRSLEIINPSFWSFEGLRPQNADFGRSLLRNSATGCTMIANSKLMAMVQLIPDHAIMHDWWMIIVAKAFGVAHPIERSTILYRQHGKNVIGAKGRNGRTVIVKILRFFDNSEVDLRYKQARDQAIAFNAQFPNSLVQPTVKDFISLKRQNFLLRKITMIRRNFLRDTFMQSISWLVRL